MGNSSTEGSCAQACHSTGCVSDLLRLRLPSVPLRPNLCDSFDYIRARQVGERRFLCLRSQRRGEVFGGESGGRERRAQESEAALRRTGGRDGIGGEDGVDAAPSGA